jgi:signal peptidase I
MEKRKNVVREYVEAIVIAVVLAMFIRSFVVQAFKIPSGSMEPTLLIGDHILVNKFIYGITVPFTHTKLYPLRNPQRGDVIVFIYPVDESKDFIKRVIGVGGDSVEIRQKKIYINGKPLKDTYGHYEDSNYAASYIQFRDNLGPITVPKGSLFVMGDNRDRSYDSRFWGFVKLNMVKGKAFLVYWSWGDLFKDIRWNRIGKLIH